CPNFSIQNFSDSNLRYSFSGVNSGTCIAKMEFSYKVTSSTATWNHSFSLIDLNSWSLSSYLDINVTSLNSLKRIASQDNNSNWYIDWFKLEFSTWSLTWFSNSWLSIWWHTPTLSSVSWAFAFLSITDSEISTWDFPQIINTSPLFNWVSLINNFSIEDLARPQILKINQTNYSLSNPQTINISQTWFNLSFSEKMSLSAVNGFSLKLWTSPIAWTFSLSPDLKTLTFASQSNLWAWYYSLTPNNQATDWNLNILPSLAITLYKQPICPIWYTISWISCIAPPSSWWGWGWGWGWGGWSSITTVDYCPNWDLSWSFYDKLCNIPQVNTWTVSSWWTTQELTISTINNSYYKNLDEARKYLKTIISDPNLIRQIDNYHSKLNLNDIDFYLGFDNKVKMDFNKIINSYVLLFKKLDLYSKTKDISLKTDINSLSSILSNYIKSPINPSDSYVTKISNENWIVYKTKFSKIQNPLEKLETKILNKFKLLKVSWTISNSEYSNWINAYNDFVLYLSIYRTYKPKEAKNRAIEPIRIFTGLYSKKIEYSQEEIQKPAEEKVVSLKIKDKYIFTKNLNFWDSNDEIKNLQIILKSYWYFGDFTPTWYFWNTTKAYLISFSKDILKIDNPNWLFNEKIRTLIWELELK
ncbi:MAG: hypothetical protein ACD_4C00295G0002, partial [uncultured bacterium (gcode 4)]